jgi:hypothetical protein
MENIHNRKSHDNLKKNDNILEIDKKEKINLCQKLSSFKRTGDDLVSSINSIISSWDDIILKKQAIINSLNKDIENAKDEIKKMRDEFSTECDNIRIEFNKERNDWKNIIDESKKFKIDKIIKLNVGGYNFVTSKNMFDSCWLKNNFLTSMFSGSWEPNKDNDDNYFIDRDGLYFNHILNFIRDSKYKLIIKSLDKTIQKAILIEANYYRIDELVTLLKNKIYQGDELINQQIRVFWEKENKWFKGVIYRYNKYDDKHYIRYDDGDENSYKLKTRKWELL